MEEHERNMMDRLMDENRKLRIAARLIHQRSQVKSGSKEMADIDSFCKSINLRVWEWPLGDFWEWPLGDFSEARQINKV